MDYTQRRMLRRETAIELPVTPSKLQKSSDSNQEFQISNERRAISADNPSTISRGINMSYLIPESDQHRKKPSNESLHKNSSSETTEYSTHPYHVIKQNSNDTNSSFNIDNSSFTNDLSLEAETSTTLNSTVIENTAATEVFPKRASTISATDTSRANVALLRKQYSVDHHCGVGSGVGIVGVKRPLSENLERAFTLNENRTAAAVTKISPRIHMNMNVLKESSSTSTEDTKEDARRIMPSISTHLVQDEIAKLSLNIKSSTEEDEAKKAVDDDNVETMC